MIVLSPTRFPSTNVHSIGFEGEARGKLHVQFKDKNGRLTVRGYYADVQQALFRGLEADRKPGGFINDNLKGWFEWVALENVKPFDDTLPDKIFLPPETPNTDEAVAACIDGQRITPERTGLFE